MINFYQRYILKRNDHDSWLEETSAMISEDTLSNSVFGTGVYNKISGRTQTYLSTGGGVDYANWPSTADNRYYNIGGAFGAYLNRKYGLGIMKGLVNNCNDGGTTATTNSYACLDNLIKTLGGNGFAEDYSRFGASVFARIPPTGQPANYGYPVKTDGVYTYSAFNPSLWAAPPTTTGALAATQQQHFVTDTTVSSPYIRSNVVVPANTTLTVVIQ
jgi:Peptidase M30